MNNLPLGTEFDSSAPWNDKDIYCPECGSDQLKITDSGSHKSIKWCEYTCTECGTKISKEPNYE